MFARIISARLKPNTVVELTQIIEKEILPVLRKQPGFQDEMTLVSPGGAKAVAISVWTRKEDADAYGRNIYPDVLKSLGRVIEGTPHIRVYEVCHSTFDKIAARVAA